PRCRRPGTRTTARSWSTSSPTRAPRARSPTSSRTTASTSISRSPSRAASRARRRSSAPTTSPPSRRRRHLRRRHRRRPDAGGAAPPPPVGAELASARRPRPANTSGDELRPYGGASSRSLRASARHGGVAPKGEQREVVPARGAVQEALHVLPAGGEELGE